MKHFLSKGYIFSLFLVMILIVQVSIAHDEDNNSDTANVFTLGVSRLGKARLGESSESERVISKMLLSALSEAVREGNTRVLQALLDTGRDIIDIELNEMEQTPLIMAAMHEQEDVVRLLLRFGATIDLRDKNDDTALMKTRSVEIARLLVDAKADINVRNIFGYTPLMNAAANRSKKVYNFLLDRGADAHCLYALLEANFPLKPINDPRYPQRLIGLPPL